jgi:hypothetical protein
MRLRKERDKEEDEETTWSRLGRQRHKEVEMTYRRR